MKCKQGDLAIVVKSAEGQNVGRIVTCVKFLGTVYGKNPTTGREFRILQTDLWELDQALSYTNGQELPYASDECLMPIGSIYNNVVQKEAENVS